MAETENISKMADLASTEIFSVFGWEDLKLRNENWDCVEQTKHKKLRGTKTHPSDVVYRYTDPYSGKETYVNTDLKSYKATTLESFDVVKALRSLSHSVECAAKSKQWQTRFIDTDKRADVIGMLFVYNHDGKYDGEFEDVLSAITSSKTEIAQRDFIGVVSPKRVLYLNSIGKEIKSLHSDGMLPAKADRYFFFPHLGRAMALHQKHNTIPLDHLLSPLTILGYEFPASATLEEGASKSGVYAFYDGENIDEDEFKYLLDYFIKYQIADGIKKVVINLVYDTPDASAIFEKAKRSFVKDYWPLTGTTPAESKNILNTLSIRNVQSVVPHFHTTQIGMVRTQL